MNEADKLTVEKLVTQLGCAMYCTRLTIPGRQFRALFDLAKRVQAFENSYLGHLDTALDRKEVRLTGREIRMLLMLALQAKHEGLPPRLRGLRKQT